ncbi:MAG: xanthine dehydrogenase family protein subunit M, partial [Alphaproteobacteria bacterium]|nr:xanthine dehydrogenase family protein subunit M [Alphaproteobacteria bacterium]
MKPARFEYHAPASLGEALSVLERYRGEARLLAGGQSLVPMMNFRLATPAAIVDLNRIGALAGLEEEDGIIRIGAMTRQRQIEFAPLVERKLPLLREAVRWIGHLPTRTRGTIGGSIAHADPAAEIPMILQALAGEVVVHGPQGERRIAAPDLFVSPLTTSLATDEIITEVRFAAMPAEACFAIEEFARRKGDFAIAAIAVMLIREADRCTKARLATAGIGPVTSRLREAEAILEEKGLDEPAIAAAAEKAAELVEPMSDQHGSADFRRHLTAVLTRRAVRKAI